MSAAHKKHNIKIRTHKFMANPLLSRKQMVVEVSHPNRGTVPKAEIKERLGKMFNPSDKDTVIVYGFKTAFGGGKSTGFALIYDDMDSCKKYEPGYRLKRFGLFNKKGRNPRKAKKETKNRVRKLRGTAKTKPAKAGKGKKK